MSGPVKSYPQYGINEHKKDQEKTMNDHGENIFKLKTSSNLALAFVTESTNL